MDELISFLKERFPDGIQMFNTCNLYWDVLINVYNNNGVEVYFCPTYNYIEIFGLSKEEFEKVKYEVADV